MTRHFSPDRNAEILNAVATYRDGAPAALLALLPALSHRPQRTLRHRPKRPVQPGRLVCSGKSTATRYRLGDDNGGSDETARVASGSSGSAVVRAMRVLVRRPLVERPSAIDDRSWLDAYRPNGVFYLSAESPARFAAFA